MDAHTTGDFTHGGQEGEGVVGELDGFVGNGFDLLF